MKDKTMKKIFTLLLLLNLISTLSVGYIIYEETSSKKSSIIEIESPVTGDIEELLNGDKEFKSNVYQGMGRLLMGQQMNTLRLFALHHYLKPHVEFIENCPECEIEKQKILQEDKESVTALEAG